MKIASRIILGYAILITIMAALIAYQATAIHRMQSTVTRLSSLDFGAGRLSLQLMRDRDLIEEFAKKYFADKYPGFAERLAEFRGSFEHTLAEIRPLVRSKIGLTELDRLAEIWQDFNTVLAEYQNTTAPNSGGLPEALRNQLETLGAQVLSLHLALLANIDAEAKATQQIGQRVEWISWAVAGLTLLVSCLVSFLIARSISQPLRQLAAGTRAVAEGKFLYHLDSSGSDEVSALASDFNVMTDKLGQLDRLKKDFVSHVSHELKSPLASMQETIRLLLDQLPGPLTDKQKRLLELNLHGARRLSSMIANLLDLSRMEAGAMHYDIRSCDLSQIMRTVVAEMEPNAFDKKISINLIPSVSPLTIECDHDRIIQVLVNLLGNAIKYSPASSTIEVSASSRDNSLIITIADRGPGVPDDHKQKIFEKFHQIHAGKKIAGQGVGLGLAISRTIVEAHGGAIWAEDNPGGGSRFMVQLPSKSGARRQITQSPPI